MATDVDRNPKRHAARQLRKLDLSVPDPRVVWATQATASSEWSREYPASAACGPPAIFPQAGDHKGTWLASSDDNAPWLEVTFGAISRAVALIVCETCGPGSVLAARDLDRDAELLRADQSVPKSKNGAQLLVVPLDPNVSPPRRVRLMLSGHKSDHQQIDAVGLLTEPLDALLKIPPTSTAAVHRRYAPKNVPLHDLRGDPRLVWAERAHASSEYSAGYEAKQAVGRPNVFPRGGDHTRTWLSADADRNAWLDLSFATTDPCYGFVALETSGAGAIVRATDAAGNVLWSARPERLQGDDARLLHVPFDPPRPLAHLRLWVSPAIDQYREIDAVALLRAPFRDLETEAPEPPAPPPALAPGEPEGGFTLVSGVLRGPTPAAPLLHLRLRTRRGPISVNRAGEVRLELETGREVTLEIDHTTLYGRPLLRREVRFGELTEELPWLRAALDAPAPLDDEVVQFEGDQFTGGERVFVAGTPTLLPSAGGFREAAGTYERLVAAAIANRPLSSTPFPANGTREFHRGATLGRTRSTNAQAPHPLERARRMAWRFTGGAALLFSWMAFLAASAPVVGSLALGFGFSLWATLASLVVALEFEGRSAMIVTVRTAVAQRRKHREPVRFTPPRMTAILTAVFALCAALPFGLLLTTLHGDALVPTVSLTLALTGAHALARVFVWQWSDHSGIGVALPLLLAPQGVLGNGKPGRFTGALNEACRCHERFTAHREHLGTTESVDANGRVNRYDEYRDWQTRSASSSLRPEAGIFLADGSLLSAGRVAQTVDVALRPQAATAPVYANFASEHAPGDVAHFFGVARQVDGRFVMEPCSVLLGDLRALRRETRRHLGALLGLVLLVAAGLVATVELAPWVASL